ncbi:MAG: YceI family protein [Sciscionella sp.]|nr:YceI family protein [Sciscionella sp.]
MTANTETITGYTTGTWTIDPVHSSAAFAVRHLGVSKVRGHFTGIAGTITTGQHILDSRVEVTIDANSIDTGNEQRDEHVRGADFLDVANHPQLTFRSTGIRADGDDYAIDGELTIHGVSKPVTLAAELGGFGPGLHGGTVIGASASTEISRKDFGITGGPAGAVVGDKIAITLDIEAGLNS